MKYPFPYVYHSHTKRCGHAQGEDEEIVLAAIEAGIKVLCFSDHCPFPNVHQPTIRMEVSEMNDYVSSIRFLAEKYKDQIEIHVGFEAEYCPETRDFLKHLVDDHVVDFLILGQHGYFENGVWSWYGLNRHTQELYVEYSLEALNSGLFYYFAHPDILINYVDDYNDFVKVNFAKLTECAIKNNVVMEVNVHGLFNRPDNNLSYPNVDCWKIASQYKKCKFTIGVDAHNPKEFEDNWAIRKVLEIVKEANLKITRRLPRYKKK